MRAFYRDLYPLIAELNRWGDRWLAGEKGPPLLTFHRKCGQRLDSKITCDQCGTTPSGSPDPRGGWEMVP